MVLYFLAISFWRLYPTYLIVVTATLLLDSASMLQLPSALRFTFEFGLIALVKTTFLWISNISMMLLNLPSTSDLLIGPSWSLGVEVSFYLIAPFCLRLGVVKLLVLTLVGIVL